jgi:hypothetical protein
MTLIAALLTLNCARAPRPSSSSGGGSSNGGDSAVPPSSGGVTQVSSSTDGPVGSGGNVAVEDGGQTTSSGTAGNGGTISSSGTASNSAGASSAGTGSNGSTPSGGSSSGAAGSGGGRATSGTGGAAGAGGSSSVTGGKPSTSGSTTPTGPCTTDSQCPNGHCVGGSCVCWDPNQKVCSGTCTDVKYNNNACGDCNSPCPATAPRCDNGTCKCDSPPCGGGGTPTGGTSGNGGTVQGGATATGGNSKTTGGVTSTGGSTVQGGTTATGGSSGGGTQPPPISNGTDGWATRYWDCCKPSCGWSAHASTPMQSCAQDNSRLSSVDTQSACQGSSAFMCWDFVPWSVSDSLSYGFAAFNGANCGTCFQLQFTGASQGGDAKSTPPLSGKTMIVQIINSGGLQSNQFDLLIPGGGVGDFNACSTQWGSSDLGAAYGGFLAACSGDKTCVQNKCSTLFSGKPLLQAGCTWFTGWFNAGDNPALKYQQITCPSAITSKSGMSG